jgi:transposase
MANNPIGMVKVKRIIQLRAENTSKLKISKQLKIHRKTLNEYLVKLESTGKSYQELLNCSEAELMKIVYDPLNTRTPDPRFVDLQRQFPKLLEELSRTGVTRQLLWEEYKSANPSGYEYTQFCEHLARYNLRNKATMHFTHRPADYLQVDFAGKSLQIIDPNTGEISKCPVLVCVLPFSKYTYVEALPSAKQEHVFNALSRCMEYFGGVPRNILSDNMKQYIKKNEKYEFKFSEVVDQWAAHYNTNLEATRPRKPKDKPTVEGSVYTAYLRIYAKLRNETFHDLFFLNKRIHDLLTVHQNLPFQKLSGSRYEQFVTHERHLLKPLPPEPFQVKHVTTGKVQRNYHVPLGEDGRFYSVHYHYIGQPTTIIYDQHTVEIFIGIHKRIATHKRKHTGDLYVTCPDHMPPKHLKYKEVLGWDADYFLTAAKKIGDNSVTVFKKVLSSKDFVEQSYLSCVGLIRLSKQYGHEKFEQACIRALKGSRVNFGIIRRILEKKLYLLNEVPEDLFTIPRHSNLRGKGSYR